MLSNKRGTLMLPGTIGKLRIALFPKILDASLEKKKLEVAGLLARH